MDKKEKIDTENMNYEFNSHICTSLMQSERLLKLGLNKKTADCAYLQTFGENKPFSLNGNPYSNTEKFANDKKIWSVPAWSLHRLLCLINNGNVKFVCNEQSCWGGNTNNFKDRNDFQKHDNVYDNICNAIEWLIEKDKFKKEYLV